MLGIYSNIDDKNDMCTTINSIVFGVNTSECRVGLWPELTNYGYESKNKWADGLYQLQQLQRFAERAPHD